MTKTQRKVPVAGHAALAMAFGILVFLIFTGALVSAWSMSRSAALMPIAIATAGMVLCLVAGVRYPLRRGSPPAEGGGVDIDEMTEVPPLRAARYAGWMAAYVIGMWLSGLFIATVLFTAIFLRVERRASPLVILIVGLITISIALTLGHLLNIRWPAGLLLP